MSSLRDSEQTKETRSGSHQLEHSRASLNSDSEAGGGLGCVPKLQEPGVDLPQLHSLQQWMMTAHEQQ